MRQDLEHSEVLLEGPESRTLPHTGDEFNGRPRTLAQEFQKAARALIVMPQGIGNPGPMPVERFAVSGEDQIDIVRLEFAERREEIRERVSVRKPRDVRRNVGENVVAGE